MNEFKLLDCTLREAPLEDLMWGDLSIRRMIDGLEKSGIDIIEVGFLKNNIYRFGSTSFRRVEEIAPYLSKKKVDTLYVALVDYGKYDLNFLSDYDGKSIDAIRVCFKHDEINDVLDYAGKIREKGYKVCIQHVDTMGYSDQDILAFVEKVNEFKPYAYAIVDTFGAMYGNDVLHYAEIVSQNLDSSIWLGLHGHNNLMLADSNAELLVKNYYSKRKIIIDSSLYGCGRGAGNAHTELISQFMNYKYSYQYDINEVLDLIDTVVTPLKDKAAWGYSIPYFISGIHNSHTFNVKRLLSRHNIKSKDLRGIIEMLDERQKKVYDYALLEELYVRFFDNPIDDISTLNKIEKELSGKKILLLAPGMQVKKQFNEIQKFVEKENPVIIAVNNLIAGFNINYIFISSSIRYKELLFQNIDDQKLPHIIVTSNIKKEAELNEDIVNYRSLIKFGWTNIDSSMILLFRLLLKCNINEFYAAGLDGYKGYGNDFYKNELDRGIDIQSRNELTEENISMLRDLKHDFPDFTVHFITDSIYRGAFL